MNPPQKMCACDNFTHPVFGHDVFQTETFRKFQVDLNAVELKEFSVNVSNCSSQGVREDAIYSEFLHPIHNDVNIIMGQNKRIMRHMNSLPNHTPITKQVASGAVVPTLVEVSTRRKTRVERVASETRKGNVVLHRTRTGLKTVADLWKEHECGWDNNSPPLRELESKRGSE